MDAQSAKRKSGEDPESWSDPALASSLQEFETSPEAEHLKRLSADRKLLDAVMWAEYKGPVWEQFATRLVQYGLAVLRGWLRNGRIFLECARRKRRIPRRDIPPELVDELAFETVGEAIINFRNYVLIPGRWDPSKGATLATFFIGQCLMKFPNQYRRWLGQRENQPMDADEYRAALPPHVMDPERQLRESQKVEALPDEMANIGAGMAMGFTYQEIADKLGSTTRGIETKRWRFKEGVSQEALGEDESKR
jgi:hypothetical protein